MNKLKGALIGCGAIAREHLAAIADLQNVDIVGVCDISPARAQATAERFNIGRWYTSHRELLSQSRVDLVHVTTPPSTHYAIVEDCLSSGMNVLCEKPIVSGYDKFAALAKLAIEKGCYLIENQQFRCHSSVARLRQMLDSGELGDLLELQVGICLDMTSKESPYVDRNARHFSMDLPGGPIGDFLPHIVYLTRSFLGEIGNLRTIWSKHTQDTLLPFDECRAFMQGARGSGYVSVSGNARPDAFNLRLVGTRMRAEANLFEPPRIVLKRGRSGEPAVATVFDGLAESAAVLRGTLASFYRKIAGRSSYDGLSHYIANIYNAIGDGRPQPIPMIEIGEDVRLVERLTALDLRL